jgi:hypothetical protein
LTALATGRTKAKGRSVRALNPLAEGDAALLQAVSRGEFMIHGFRNRDLREILHGPAQTGERPPTASQPLAPFWPSTWANTRVLSAFSTSPAANIVSAPSTLLGPSCAIC